MKTAIRWAPLALAVVLPAASPVLAADEAGPAATPYRPSVSSPAALPEPGWLDMEFGALRATGGGDRHRDSLPVAAKLAFDKDWGVVVGTELGVRRADLDNQVFTGVGDTTLQLKHRIPTGDEDIAWGIAFGFKSPTARDSIGSGKSDLLLTGIYSADLPDDNHFDANIGASRLGAYEPGENRTQYAWAAALSHNLSDRWSVFGEPSGTYRRGVPSTAQFLAGASYAHSKRAIFDLAVARRLTNAGPDWQFMMGMTVLVGRLW